jgi:hypothetical protein
MRSNASSFEILVLRFHVDANSWGVTVNHSDRSTKSQSSLPEPDAAGDGARARQRRKSAPTPGPSSSEVTNLENGGEDSYRVGYGKPPLHTRFPKGHPGYKRRKVAEAEPQDFLAEVLNELSQLVPVTENGKRRKLPGMTVSAKTMVQALMRGDPKARAQFIQLSTRAGSQAKRDLQAQTDEKPRRSHKQIMEDFAQDMWDESYQFLCDITGGANFTHEEVFKRMRDLIHEKGRAYPSDHSIKMTLFMLASVQMFEDRYALDVGDKNGHRRKLRN